MDETIRVEVIDKEKSSYRIELVKASGEKFYLSIEQIVYSLTNETKSQIKIRADTLESIIKILITFQSEIPKDLPKRGVLSPARKLEVINRYLNKNLEIETLAVQFDCTVKQIEQLLFDENIFVVSNKISVNTPRKFWRRKKKSGS